eukprot:scaffold8649_cov185-Amphora_coffeaeformis.AAC.1
MRFPLEFVFVVDVLVVFFVVVVVVVKGIVTWEGRNFDGKGLVSQSNFRVGLFGNPGLSFLAILKVAFQRGLILWGQIQDISQGNSVFVVVLSLLLVGLKMLPHGWIFPHNALSGIRHGQCRFAGLQGQSDHVQLSRLESNFPRPGLHRGLHAFLGMNLALQYARGGHAERHKKGRLDQIDNAVPIAAG